MADAINSSIGYSNSGVTNTFTTTNPSNTAASQAKILATVGGTSSGDPFFTSTITGGSSWSWGADNSDSDAFVISQSTGLGTNNIMRSTTTGEITYPLQPAFVARLSADAVDVTGDGTQYNVVWNTTTLDQNSDFNTTTGVFTAPVSGLYAFTSCITIDQVGASHTAAIWRFIISSSQYRQVSINPFVSAPGTAISQTLAGIIKMTAGDTAQTQIIVSNGTKIIDVLWGSSTSVLSYFSGHLIC